MMLRGTLRDPFGSALGLRRFLREPRSVSDCYDSLRSQLENREENFLSVLSQRVYPNPESPYYKLLSSLRCDFDDVRILVRRHGLEKALEKLSDMGVYVTIEEYRGQRPVERNGVQFQVTPEDFINQNVGPHLNTTTGGTRSRGVFTPLSFTFLENEAVAEGIMFDEFNGHQTPYTFCSDSMPRLVQGLKVGIVPERWFLPVTTQRNKLAMWFVLWLARSLGYRLPAPERTGVQDADRIALWLATKRESGVPNVVRVRVSGAVRICAAAKERGLDIAGTHFLVGSEPVTVARRRAILATGATLSSLYAAMEIGVIGRGCAQTAGDDVHVLNNHVAVIQKPRLVITSGTTVDAFRFTSLSQWAPMILINMENGDFGRLEKRECSCKFGSLGLHDRVSQIRSFEKLTSEGMAFFASDLARIVEEVLPEKFGGNPLDYQAVEDQGEGGASRVLLFVSPRLPLLDENQLIETFYAELAKGGGPNRRMADSWKEAGTVQIERRAPEPTRGGKVFPFQLRWLCGGRLLRRHNE